MTSSCTSSTALPCSSRPAEPGRSTAIFPASRCSRPAARRADPGRAPRRVAPAAAGAGRARHRPALHEPLDAEHVDRHEFLSARFVYDEVQPEAERAARRAAGPGGAASLPGRGDAPGDARDPLRAAGDPRRDRRPARGQPPAGGRGAGRADGAARRRGLLPRPGREADQGPHPRQRPRHESRLGAPRRLRGRHDQERRPRPRRPGRLQGQARRRDRRLHDHQPEHGRPVRPADRRDRRRCCTTGAPCSTSTAPT